MITGCFRRFDQISTTDMHRLIETESLFFLAIMHLTIPNFGLYFAHDQQAKTAQELNRRSYPYSNLAAVLYRGSRARILRKAALARWPGLPALRQRGPRA